jgi:hypothetical protein
VPHGEAGRERVLREFRQDAIWQATYEEYRRLLSTRKIAVPGRGVLVDVRPGGSHFTTEGARPPGAAHGAAEVSHHEPTRLVGGTRRP